MVFRQDGRAAFFALIDHHAGDEKYRSIAKTLTNKLMTTKWNGKVYSMEKHVSTHRQCYEELINCLEHVTTLVPGEEQRVQYLIDSIDCGESSVQATICMIRNNMNDMRSSFEKSASALIDVDPYVKVRHRKHGGRTANISSLEYTGRGGTGVDLRWHTPQEYRQLTKEQKDELHQWQQSAAGKEVINKSREEFQRSKKGKGKGNKKTPKKRKKWLNNYAEKPKGRAHIMSLIAKRNDNDMDVDDATGNIAAVNAWPHIDPGRNNQVTVPPGFYTPRQLRKKKRELKTRLQG